APESGLERFAATAALARVRVGNLESPAAQCIAEIDHRAAQIICAERIDQHRHTEKLCGEIVGAFFVKDQTVFQAGASAAFDKDSQNLARVIELIGDHCFDLAGGVFSQADHGFT